MQLKSVNVAKPQLLTGTARGDVMSSIHKRPVEGSVMVRRLNVDGDAQGDPTVHGGPDAAVYVYAFEDYAFWTAQLKRELDSFGWFGENLTVEGAVVRRDVFRRCLARRWCAVTGNRATLTLLQA